MSLASPKSATFTPPRSSRSRFDGFTSRCTMPRLPSGVESAARVARGGQRLGPRQPSAPRQLVREAARQQLHRREGVPLLFTGRVERHHLRMHEAGDELDFAQEPLPRVAGRSRREHLQGDQAIQGDVFRAIDDAHATRGDARLNQVRAEARPGPQRAARGGTTPTAVNRRGGLRDSKGPGWLWLWLASLWPGRRSSTTA